jgi:hypothetical protein
MVAILMVAFLHACSLQPRSNLVTEEEEQEMKFVFDVTFLLLGRQYMQ